MIWILLTVMAAAFQSVRTSIQKSLTPHSSPWVITWIRAGLGLPFALIYLGVLYTVSPSLPALSLYYILLVATAAIAQLLATYFMIRLFASGSYMMGTLFAKSEALQTAILGSILFTDTLSPLGWLIIILGTLSVILISASSHKSQDKQVLNIRYLCLGLASGLGFAICALSIRYATLALSGSPAMNAGMTLVGVLTLQAIGLGAWILLTQSSDFAILRHHTKKVWLVGITSVAGSIGWFTAFALIQAAYVKTVGQIELLFALLLSHFLFKERLTLFQKIGFIGLLISILGLLFLKT